MAILSEDEVGSLLQGFPCTVRSNIGLLKHAFLPLASGNGFISDRAVFDHLQKRLAEGIVSPFRPSIEGRVRLS